MKSEEIKLSVVVPVYNVIDYLEDCVISVISQNRNDWEMLLIDDGSTDGSGELCDSLALSDSRISVIHKSNGGLSSARNVGIENAKGEYITFLDSDDYISSGFFGIMMSLLAQYHGDIAMCDHLKVAQNSHPQNEKALETEKATLFSGKECIKAVYQSDIHGVNWLAWSKVFKRSLFTNNQIEFPVGMINEDVATVYKLIYNADRVVYCDSKLYYYRNRSNSIMTSPFSQKRLEIIGKTRETCDFFLVRNEEELAALAFNYHIRSAYTLLYKYESSQAAESDKKKIVQKIKKQLKEDVRKYSGNRYLSKTKRIVYTLVSAVPYKAVLKLVSYK